MNREKKGLVGIHNLSALHNWCQIEFTCTTNTIHILHIRTRPNKLLKCQAENGCVIFTQIDWRDLKTEELKVSVLNLRIPWDVIDRDSCCYKLFFCESLDMQKEEEEDKKNKRKKLWEEELNQKWRHQGHRQIAEYSTWSVFQQLARHYFCSPPLMSTAHLHSPHQTVFPLVFLLSYALICWSTPPPEDEKNNNFMFLHFLFSSLQTKSRLG